MIDFNITSEEIEALKLYINNKYEAINQMLVSDCETDIDLLSSDVENKIVNIDYDKEAIIEYLKTIKLIYRLIIKKFYNDIFPKKNANIFYRGTNLSEIERYKNELYIDRFLMTSENIDKAINNNSANWNRPACMNLKLDINVPYIYVKDFLSDEKFKEDILISPFTKIKKVSEDEEKTIEKNSKTVKIYNIELEKQKLDELSEEERYGLYNFILENSYVIKRKIEQCIELEKENATNFENIRKLEQLLNKYENANDEEIEEKSDMEIETDTDDIQRITKELDELKEISTNVFKIRKENIDFVNVWKRNIAVYMIAECKEIEKEFDSLINKEYEIENSDKEELESVEEIEEDNIENKVEDENDEEDDEVKKQSKENVEAGKKLLENIKKLITKQQNHAKIAGNIGATYSALNNAFEMKKSAEVLLELLKNIDSKLNQANEENNSVEIDKIAKTNLEISTLINYLNNPKIVGSNIKATRFDEMFIIEENQLKKGIFEKVRNIRGEAELKKLKEDLEIIEDKGFFSKLLGIFTGRNKLDEFMIEQIEIRKEAIKKNLSHKLGLAYNYSIHELIAEIQMFINDNYDDELVEEDIETLKKLANELKQNFVILESKVQSIIEEKEGRNLPVKNKRLSKRDMLEIQTYRFLNKYGYDEISNLGKEEPKYQDTMTSEISRIIEYINSSEIL